MLKKISITLLSAFVLAGILVGANFIMKNTEIAVAEASGCVPNAKQDLGASYNSDNTTATFTNRSETCTYKVGFASYKKFDENIRNQVIHDFEEKNIAPLSSVSITIDIPSCSAQLDTFEGTTIQSFASGIGYTDGNRLLYAKHINGTNYCTNTPSTATLKVTKYVINDNGGSKHPSDFLLYVGNTQVTTGVSNTYAPGTYTVREVNLPGYQAGNWAGDCAADGRITLVAGDNKHCYINNNDVPPSPTNGTLRIVKTVINDDGGTRQVSDFALFIENTQVTSGQVLTLPTNWYTVRENNLSGYEASSWGGDCSSDGRVYVEAGKNKTCTITNNDVHRTTSGGGGSSSSLKAYCVANPTKAEIDEEVTWKATASGGRGSYSYSWDGSDDVESDERSFETSYDTAGKKYATVTVKSGSKTATAKCYVKVEEDEDEDTEVTVTTVIPPQDGGIYLSQVPYTGIGSTMKISTFILGLLLWSTAIAYYMIKRKAQKHGLSVNQFIAEGGISNSLAYAGTISTQLPRMEVITETVTTPIVEAPLVEAVSGDFMSSIESRARSLKMIISADALNIIAAVTGREHADAHSMIDKLAATHRKEIIDQNDWVIVNAQKVSAIL